MSDPFRIFAAAPRKQDTLKALWPELHACLAGADKPAVEPVRHCVIGECSSVEIGRRRRAVARIDRWGHTACAEHIAQHSDRPGGWPLDLKEHKR
jgi:hypothetical protein